MPHLVCTHPQIQSLLESFVKHSNSLSGSCSQTSLLAAHKYLARLELTVMSPSDSCTERWLQPVIVSPDFRQRSASSDPSTTSRINIRNYHQPLFRQHTLAARAATTFGGSSFQQCLGLWLATSPRSSIICPVVSHSLSYHFQHGFGKLFAVF